MKDRTIVMVGTCALIGYSVYSGDTAAFVAAVAGSGLLWQGHNIEIKINKLLDDRNIGVTRDDLDQ